MPPTDRLGGASPGGRASARPLGLASQAANAVAWSAGGQISGLALRFAVGVVLARLLTPDDFGVMGMAAVVTGFADVFADVGFGAAIIQRQRIEERHLSSVFWLNVLVGLGLSVAVAAASPLLAAFFDRPILVPLTLVAGSGFVLGSVAIVPAALLSKQLRFRTLSKIDLVALAAGGGAGVAAALGGAAVWSLVIATLARTLMRGALLFGAVGWRPSSTFDREAIRELTRFSRNVLGFNSVNYWIRNADNVLVGRFLDAAALGIYTRAYQLMLLPLTVITRSLNRVMFPALAGIQDDPGRVGRIHLRVVRAVALVSFPMMIGLLVTAHEFVLVCFGEPWLPMVPALQILSVAGMIDSIGALNGNLYLSQGRSDLQLRVASILGMISIPFQAVGLIWGVAGVAAAYTIYATLAFVPAVSIAARLVDLRLLEILRALAGPFLCSLLMATALVLLADLAPEGISPLGLLSARAACGAALYTALVHGFGLVAPADMREVFLREFRKPA